MYQALFLGGQDLQDAIEQPAGVDRYAANLPEIVVNFPEDHTLEYYLRGLIIWDDPITQHAPLGPEEY